MPSPSPRGSSSDSDAVDAFLQLVDRLEEIEILHANTEY